MKIKKSLIKNILIGIIVLGILSLGVMELFNNKSDENFPANTNVVSTSGDSQVVDLTAKGGYSPASITAKSGMNTTLRVKTSNTFDCSSALRIPSLNINKPLPPSGTTDINLGSQSVGTTISITCAMGMYNAKISFI